MKKLFKYSLLMAAAVLAVVSCKDEERTTAGEWNATTDYANLYFPTPSQTFELDPTDPTSVQIEVVRRNTQGALSVTFDQLQNDNNIFTVGSANFADGDSLATITVSFPDAEIGTAYNLELSTTDPRFVSAYSDSIIYNMSVTRIKWNLLGNATFVEGFWYELEDVCPIYQRDDKPNQYRLEDPFKLAREAEYTDGNESEYLTFTIYSKTEVENNAGTDNEVTLIGKNVADYIGDDDLVYFSPLNTGYFHPSYSADVMMYHPAHFSSLTDWTYNHVVSYQKDAVEVNGVKRILPGRIDLAPYYYMIGVGGWNYTQSAGIVQIFFPGYTDPHVADIASDDFTWEEVFAGNFTSGKTGASEAKLFKGTCVNQTDGCDTIFAQNYGTAYRIEEPYAEGYDLYFAVDKNGKIVMPDGYRLQPTGLDDNMGHDIYAKIDQTTSTFSEKEIILNINFVSEDEELDYGTSEEILANISWTEIGSGTYTYVAMVDEPTPDEGLPFSKRDDKDNIFKIGHWYYDVELSLEWDQETNQVVIPAQYTGLSYDGYGDVYVSDVAVFTGNTDYYSDYPCTYDPEAKTFSFNPIYFILQNPNKYQWMGDDPETFVLDADGSVKAKKSERVLPSIEMLKSNSQITRMNPWKGAKMKKKDRLNRTIATGFNR